MDPTERALLGTPAGRDAVVERITAVLLAGCPGSLVEPRGSLAAGTADAYSDIDLAWTVPDADFPAAVARVAAALDAELPLLSARDDPDFQRSAGRRLLFFLFRDLPLFWRLDLEVRAASTASDPGYDADNPAARGDDWSRTASALANAVAAVKAVRRDRPGTARGLLDRAFARIGADDRATGRWAADITCLAEAAARLDPAVADLAGRVRELARRLISA